MENEQDLDSGSSSECPIYIAMISPRYALPLLMIASSLTGQPTEPTLADALSLLQAGDAAAAVRALQVVTWSILVTFLRLCSIYIAGMFVRPMTTIGGGGFWGQPS